MDISTQNNALEEKEGNRAEPVPQEHGKDRYS